jgi:hypothetical protein
MSEVYAALVDDEERNMLIYNDVLLALERGRTVIDETPL